MLNCTQLVRALTNYAEVGTNQPDAGARRMPRLSIGNASSPCVQKVFLFYHPIMWYAESASEWRVLKLQSLAIFTLPQFLLME